MPSRCFALLACAALIGFRATPATAQPLWKIASTPITVVADDGTTATQWNAIAGAVLLSNGDVLIGDINGEVRRFSSAGHFLRLEVRQGRGPGEMTEIKKLVPWQDGGVALSWQQYLSVGGSRSIRSPDAASGGPPTSQLITVLGDESRLELQMGWRPIGPPTRVLRDTATVVLRHSDGRTSRLLRAPYSEALVLVVAGAAGGIKFGQLEGAPRLVVAGRDSVVWFGVSGEGRLRRVVVLERTSRREAASAISEAPEPTLVTLPVRPARWTTARLATWRDWARQRALTSPDSTLADALWSAQYLPAFAPGFRSLVADVGGGVWIERFPMLPSDLPEYLVLSPSGNPIGKVLLPRQGRLLDIRHRHIVVGERDEDDVERIAVYALTRGT